MSRRARPDPKLDALRESGTLNPRPAGVADETFRALCSDLVEAQMALQWWRTSASPVREKRCSEYEELVASLAGEIASYLDAAEAGSVDVP